MPKRFRDIPQFTRDPGSPLSVPFIHLEDRLSEFQQKIGLETEPDFQRGHVWTQKQRSRFVEFVLRGGAGASVIRWNCPGFGTAKTTGPMQLVDGLQRLTAVRKFLANELPAFGLLREEYEDELSPIHHQLQFLINTLPARARVLEWYLELNAGGVVHSDEELDRVRKLLNEEISKEGNDAS